MVINCVAFGCNNLADKRSVVQFHGFPFKRPLILKEWIKAIRRDNWQPMKFSKLYSDHFLTSDYEDIGEKIYRRLKDSAIPSVFKFPQHLQKKIAPRRVLKRCLPNHTVGGDNNLNEDLNEIRLLSVQTPMIQEEETQISVGSQTDKMVESPTKIMLRKKNPEPKSQTQRYCDYGGIAPTNTEDIASEALLFQIVSYENHFKCPVGYFITNKLSAELQSQLLLSCIKMLFDVGIRVRSITCDGTGSNLSTLSKLGATIIGVTSASFKHPSLGNDATSLNIYGIDTCHMLKLARNAMAEKNLSSEDGPIKWDNLVKLNNIQNTEGLKFANALSSLHINYKNKVMNMKLAAQA
ncbi:hypothetical protein NQ314_015014 [Rhamnusium bicolor]|uniref:THAP-type domain-containing protein n=1 Tax=Rhamnusium bicolor TaxID=1586634 RepID=A0AAV8WZG3_9CUCU|nr:hypothetical protein NQ314_015014 [Rhamnusium bicolor]